MYNDWITDFRKILFCIAVLSLGTIYNVEEPKALAIAVIVQGASNIDNFWDYLRDTKIYISLKVLILLLILFSMAASIFAIFSLASTKGYFDININNRAYWNIGIVLLATAFPVIPLITDGIFNVRKNINNSLSDMNEGEEYEL